MPVIPVGAPTAEIEVTEEVPAIKLAWSTERQLVRRMRTLPDGTPLKLVVAVRAFTRPFVCADAAWNEPYGNFM